MFMLPLGKFLTKQVTSYEKNKSNTSVVYRVKGKIRWVLIYFDKFIILVFQLVYVPGGILLPEVTKGRSYYNYFKHLLGLTDTSFI